MVNCLFLMYAFGCREEVPGSEPLEGEADTPFPEEIYRWGWEPLTEHFGYDPEGSSNLQGVDLAFVNLDPAGFGSGPEGEAAVRALGWLVSHPVDDFETPIWSRVAVEPQIGPAEDRLARYGWLPSPYRAQFDAVVPVPLESGAADVSLSLSLMDAANTFDEGPDGRRGYVSFNCTMCHAGVYGQSVVLGAPNKNVNMEPTLRFIEPLTLLRDLIDTSPEAARSASRLSFRAAMESLGQPVGSDLDVSEAELMVARSSAIAFDNHLRPLLNEQTNATVGANAMSFAGPYMIACSLRPDGARLDDWDIEGDVPGPLFEQMLSDVADRGGLLPVANSRPWWLARYTGSHFNWHSTPHGADASASDLTAFTSAVPNYGNPHTVGFAERAERHHDLMAIMDLLQSPPFPGDIDWSSAGEGLVLYGETCARCHGALSIDGGGALGPDATLTLTYDESAARVPLAESGTDPLHSELAAELDYCFDNLKSNAEAAEMSVVAALPKPGSELFIGAPPLIGLWASAPYLHNASVPTLRAVLDSASRPDIWRLDPDPYAYDYEDVGVVYEALAEAPQEPKSEPADWLVYDTRLAGSGMRNTGHPYGDALSEGERLAVIELLKALSTHNVSPNPTNAPW